MQGEWTDAQRRFIEWRACPRYSRVPPNQEMLATQLDVDDSTLYRWSKLDGFQDEVNKLARQSIGVALVEVYGALLREAERGEFQHIKLVLELAGDYVQKNQSDVKGDLTFRFIEATTEPDDDD